MKKVMIVDDAPFMRELLAKIFLSNDFEVCGEAATARDAVEKYKLHKPDLVTMDIVMPQVEELDGIGAVREIMTFDPAARILVVSAMNQDILIKKAITYGAKDFVIKPFTKERIIQAAIKALA